MRFKTILKVLLLMVLLILLAAACVVAFVTAKLDLIQYADEVDTSVYQQSVLVDEGEATETGDDEGLYIEIGGLEMVETMPEIPEGEVQEEENVINILILGTDERTKEFNVNARTAAATRNGFTPISIKRVMAPGASLVCSVLNTK